MSTTYRGGRRAVTLLERVRQLRRQSTDAERGLWHLLKGRQLGGVKFRRQHQFGPYILDFYCPEQRLVVEVDGGQHFSGDQAARDVARTRYLAAAGVRVVRFSDREVLQETDAVLEAIWVALGLPTEGPHPDPLPEGEGTGPHHRPRPEGEGTSPHHCPLPEAEGIPGPWKRVPEGENG